MTVSPTNCFVTHDPLSWSVPRYRSFVLQGGHCGRAEQRAVRPGHGVVFSPADIAFELAPQALVKSCKKPSRSKFWIFAQVSRPEGVYMVIAGPIWTYPDTTPPSTKPVLEPVDSFGEVILVHDGKCMPYAEPDNLFNGPTPAQTGLPNDLAKSLIDRSVRAFHSAPGFLTALKNQGLTGDKLDPILRPLINSLSQKQALTSFRDRKPSTWLILSPCSWPSRTRFARR